MRRRRLIRAAAAATAGLAGCSALGGRPEMTDSARVALNRWGADQTVVRLHPGGTVTWTNEDDDLHRLQSTVFTTGQRRHDRATEWEFRARIRTGDTVEHSFPDPGVYEYGCSISTDQHGVNTTCGVFLVGESAQDFDRVLPCMT